MEKINMFQITNQWFSKAVEHSSNICTRRIQKKRMIEIWKKTQRTEKSFLSSCPAGRALCRSPWFFLLLHFRPVAQVAPPNFMVLHGLASTFPHEHCHRGSLSPIFRSLNGQMVAGTSTTIKRPLKTILGLANTVVLVQVSFGLTKEPRVWDQNWEIT
jgi:hypothetical protein